MIDVLTAEEMSVLLRRRPGFESPWAFPAPPGCRSLEEWARDGERRWALIRRKIEQARPTAHGSTMIRPLTLA